MKGSIDKKSCKMEKTQENKDTSGDLDYRCLYRKLNDGAYKRTSDGLVATFSREDTDMSVSPTSPDEGSSTGFIAPETTSSKSAAGGNISSSLKLTLQTDAGQTAVAT